MAGLKDEYGIETRVFVLVKEVMGNFDYDHDITLMNPLRDSIKELLADLPINCLLLHISLLSDEGYQFECALDRSYRKTYVRTLKENGIDVRAELLQATCEPSDDDARKHLGLLNQRLRQHLENFPTHYNNPVKLPGQGGALRKQKNIRPIKVKWP